MLDQKISAHNGGLPIPIDVGKLMVRNHNRTILRFLTISLSIHELPMIRAMRFHPLIRRTHYCLLLGATLLACRGNSQPAPNRPPDTPVLPGWRLAWAD
ncbi:MAG: hypothetical protein EOO39_43940, partial [Cytophagaceae bacterium]